MSESTKALNKLESDANTAAAEHEQHRYLGHYIPWYVHVLWVSFWCLEFYYILRYLIPAMRQEWLSPP